MPKIKSYAPSWLKAPAPGHQLFAQSADDINVPAAQFRLSSRAKPGPRRTIARRGTEVFVAAGKQIRWGNLAHLKGAWDSKQHRSGFRSTIKREDSDSFEIYDEDPDSTGQNWTQGEAYRVSVASLPPATTLPPQGLPRSLGCCSLSVTESSFLYISNHW